MTTDGGAIKRVKLKIKESPNPLFEEWLSEWKEEAEKNNSELRYCYGKALKSLKKYPFKLYSGKECCILENFGKKLCYMIDKKIGEYKAAHPEESHLFEEPDVPNPAQEQLTGSGKKGTKKFKSPGEKKRKPESPGEDAIKTDESEPKKRKNDYVPAYRSAPYAIILTLFEKTCVNNDKEFMTKEELQNEAQDLADASLKKPAEPGSFYTGWNSMTTLLKKDLVSKHSNPAKFKLTEKGVDLAIRLKLSVNDMEQDKNKSSNSIQSDQIPSSSKMSSPIPKSRSKSSDNSKTKSPKAKRAPRKKVAKPNNSPVKDFQTLLNSKNKRSDLSPSASERELSPTPSDKSSDTIDYDLNAENNNLKQTNFMSQQPKINEKYSSEADDNGSSQATTSSEPDETLFLLPGTFEVVLLVDNQETDGKNQRGSDVTVKGLKARGVNFEVRDLKVGDFTWICKDRANGHELVLPYIVERKRMDDLGSSIKDGRFHEQKFRLKQCALENLIYLVEKYGNGTDNHSLGLPLPTLQQASWNTQIIDGFTVKVTKDHSDSIRYLSLMTTHLTSIFKDKTLMSCKKKELPPCDLSSDLVSLMTFKEFNKGSQKNKKLTVRDMLIKHLIQMNGMSVEKALVIVEQYPTPKRLMEALKDSSTEKKIANLTYGPLKHRVGPAVAKTVTQLYTMPVLK